MIWRANRFSIGNFDSVTHPVSPLYSKICDVSWPNGVPRAHFKLRTGNLQVANVYASLRWSVSHDWPQSILNNIRWVSEPWKALTVLVPRQLVPFFAYLELLWVNFTRPEHSRRLRKRLQYRLPRACTTNTFLRVFGNGYVIQPCNAVEKIRTFQIFSTAKGW